MEKLVEVGRLRRTFGVDGKIRFEVSDRYRSSLEASRVWFLLLDGERLPYFVEQLEIGDNGGVVKFDELHSPEHARSVTGATVYLRETEVRVSDEDQGDFADQLIGMSIEDLNSGFQGEIIAIEEFPQQIMLIALGTKGERHLIPFVSSFIDSIIADESRVIIRAPFGLFSSEEE